MTEIALALFAIGMTAVASQYQDRVAVIFAFIACIIFLGKVS